MDYVIPSDISALIGGTPLVRLAAFGRFYGLGATLLAKLEYLNPAGSTKDRAALFMINDAEQSGKLAPGGEIVEPTSGNTGIGIAAVAAARGYRVTLVMPDSMSVERRRLLSAYGARIVLTDGKAGMSGAIREAERIAGETGAFMARQFDNPANAEAHYQTTGPEIWRQSGRNVDAFIAGVGTGGTVTGIGRYLKKVSPSTLIVAVEPENSPVLSGGNPGAHGLQGIGAGFVPSLLDRSVIDRIITVREADAYAAARTLASKEGYLTGITSGAALHAACVLASEPGFAGKTLAVLLPDSGDRYLSTPLYANDENI